MKNYKRGRLARRILLGIVILIGIVYLNRVSILQKNCSTRFAISTD